jgi:transcriptional regulator with XRE-family HTH domain
METNDACGKAVKKNDPQSVVRFAATLAKLRESRKLGQRELAKQTEMAAVRISRLENDHIDPRLKELVVLAERFDVTLDRLVFGEETAATRLDRLVRALLQQGDDRLVAVVERMLEGLVRSLSPSSETVR